MDTAGGTDNDVAVHSIVDEKGSKSKSGMPKVPPAFVFRAGPHAGG